MTRPNSRLYPRRYADELTDVEPHARASGCILYTSPNLCDARHHGDPLAAQVRRGAQSKAFRERSETVQKYVSVVPVALCIVQEPTNR